MIFKSFKKIYKTNQEIDKVFVFYNNLVNLARNPDLYLKGGVPDTIDGRFELIVLHAHFFIKKLTKLGDKEHAFAQNLIDCMVKDFDLSLREIGVGDLSVGKKVKHMVSSYYGRAKIYDETIVDFDGNFLKALKNNLYGTVVPKDSHLKFILEYIKLLNEVIDKIDGKNFIKCFEYKYFEEIRG